MSWARLLKRVFEFDHEHCPNCSGELKTISAILKHPVIEEIPTPFGLRPAQRQARQNVGPNCKRPD